jgi:hypothetical protein
MTWQEKGKFVPVHTIKPNVGGGGGGEQVCITPLILKLTLHGGEYPGQFTHRERIPSAHWTGGWVGPRASLDILEKRRISCPWTTKQYPAQWPGDI